MIQKIDNPFGIHHKSVREKEGNLTEFLDKIYKLQKKLETYTFSHEDKLYQARIIKRIDHSVTKTITQDFNFMSYTYTVSAVQKVTFKFVFVLKM